MNKVLVTDLVHDLLLDGFKAAGFEVDYFPDISYEEVCSIIGNYYGLIVNSKIFVNKSFIDAARNLKFVGRLGSGMEIIDREYAAGKGIAVFNSPEGNCNAVAEHALGMLLALANNLIVADTEVRNFQWRREQNRGFEIDGKTIGVIGYGYTGQAFVRKLLSWDVNILVHDKYKTNIDTHSGKIGIVGLQEILNKADIISLHLPLTDETKGYAGKEFFDAWKKPGILINTSRGKVVDTAALIEALEDKKLNGACLDVFENEKPELYTEEEKKMYSSLFNQKKLVVSPHIAGWTIESKEKLSQMLLDKIIFFLNSNNS